MNLNKPFQSLVIVLFIAVKALSQPSDILLKNINQLYQFEFTSFDSVLLAEQEKCALKTYLNWYKFLLDPEHNKSDKNIINIAERLQNLDLDSLDSGFNWFYKIYFNQYKLRVHMFRKEYFSAFKTGFILVDDLALVDTTRLLDSVKVYYDFLVAAQDYFLGYSQLHYGFLRPFLAGDPKTQINDGLKSLKCIFDSSNKFLQTEACYLLMKIYFEIRGEYNIGAEYADWLTSMYPDNILFQIEYLKCISKNIKNSTFAEDYKKQLLNNLVMRDFNKSEKEHLKDVINSL